MRSAGSNQMMLNVINNIIINIAIRINKAMADLYVCVLNCMSCCHYGVIKHNNIVRGTGPDDYALPMIDPLRPFLADRDNHSVV